MKKSVLTGEIILRKEECSPFLYIILLGKVRVEDDHGICYLSKNDFFGEEGALLKKPSSCTVIAGDETELLLLKEDEITHFIKENSETALVMIRKNVARACNAHKQFDEKNYYYQKLLEIILAANPKDSSSKEFNKIQLSLLTIAEKMELPIPSVRALFTMAQPYGDIFLDKESCVHSKSQASLQNRIQQMSMENYFGFKNQVGEKGTGHFNLLYLLNNNR